MAHTARETRDFQAAFSVLWGLALLHDQVAYRFAFSSSLDTALTLSAAALLARPRSTSALVATAAFQVLATGARLPDIFNHAWFTCLTALAILLAYAGTGFASHAFGGFAAAARANLAALYFASGFHKLNQDYFSVESGCGAGKYLQLAERLPFLPQSEAMLLTAAVASVVTELALPVLLYWKRTRALAVVAAVAFHFLLGLAGYPRFSTVSYAVLFLFLPSGIVERATVRLRAPTPAIVAAAIAATALGVLLPRSSGLRIELVLFSAYSLAMLAAAVYGTWSEGRDMAGAGRLTAAHAAVLLIVLSGASPYLGWRTLNAFSMYSNLRTEGGRSNHLLIPASWQIMGWQKDLVEIESSNVPELGDLAGSGLVIPFEQMRAVLSRRMHVMQEPLSVTYLRGGSRLVVEDAVRDGRLALPQRMWVWKLGSFRPVEARGPRACTV